MCLRSDGLVVFDYVELVLVLGHLLTAVAGSYHVPSVAVRGVLFFETVAVSLWINGYCMSEKSRSGR